MKKVLIVSLLLLGLCYAKGMQEYSAYYPKSFKPETCLAWHEDGGGSRNNCSIIIVCSGFKNGELTQYETKADACKELKSPFVIRYKESVKDDVFYLDKNEVKRK